MAPAPSNRIDRPAPAQVAPAPAPFPPLWMRLSLVAGQSALPCRKPATRGFLDFLNLPARSSARRGMLPPCVARQRPLQLVDRPALRLGAPAAETLRRFWRDGCTHRG